MPTDVCLMRSTASAISCLMVMTRLFFSSFWICSTVSAYRVLSCTDVMTANAKTCLPWAGVNVSDVLAPLLHIDTSLYLVGGMLGECSAAFDAGMSRASSTSSVVTA